MFKISHDAIVIKKHQISEAGARVEFEGLVRNHNEGKRVDSLEYSAYEEMAELEGQKIVLEAKEKFSIIDAFCFHRVGHLQIGETAVYIEVLSKHRDEAYLASRYIIDEVKSRVPIWKKEYYQNEKPEWVACHRCQNQGHHHHD